MQDSQSTKDVVSYKKPRFRKRQSRRTITTNTTIDDDQKQRIRKNNNNNNIELFIPVHKLPPSLDNGWIIDTATTSLWKHLLYGRGLIPLPAHQILSTLDDSRSDASSSLTLSRSTMAASARRKINQTRKSIQNLLHDWHAMEESLSLCQHMKFVLFTIGPSWNRTMEWYLLDVTLLRQKTVVTETSVTPNQQPLSIIAPKTNKNAQLLSRMILRELLQHEMSNLECHRLCGSFQLQVSFSIPTEVASQLFVNDKYSFSTTATATATATSCDNGFVSKESSRNCNVMDRLILRQDFHSKKLSQQFPRCSRQVEIQLGKVGRMVDVDVIEATDNANKNSVGGGDDGDNNDQVWMSMRSTIKGFRL